MHVADQAPTCASGDNGNHRRREAEPVPYLPGINSIPPAVPGTVHSKSQQCQPRFCRYSNCSQPSSTPRSSSSNFWRVGGCQCRSRLPNSTRRRLGPAVGNSAREDTVRSSDIFQGFPKAGQTARPAAPAPAQPQCQPTSRREVTSPQGTQPTAHLLRGCRPHTRHAREIVVRPAGRSRSATS